MRTEVFDNISRILPNLRSLLRREWEHAHMTSLYLNRWHTRAAAQKTPIEDHAARALGRRVLPTILLKSRVGVVHFLFTDAVREFPASAFTRCGSGVGRLGH